MIRLLTSGESHGPCLVAVIDGLPAGLEIDRDAIARDLTRRQRGYGRGGRMQIERDRASILSGVIHGQTTGAPVALQIPNRDWENWQALWAAESLPSVTVPRPGHADFAGMMKFGVSDARPILERASARETAARVAAGSLAKQLLAVFGVQVGSYVTSIGTAEADLPNESQVRLAALAEESPVRCPDSESARRMMAAIDQARADGDALGGVFVVAATGQIIGLGSYTQWDRRLDAQLAFAALSIPGVKGVEIGPAFENAKLRSTQVQDGFVVDPDGQIQRSANRAGGVEGGVSNGEPIVVRMAMKPIPTTRAAQASADLIERRAATSRYQRSDTCAVAAASIVGEAMVAWTIAGAVCEKLGGDSVSEMIHHQETGKHDV